MRFNEDSHSKAARSGAIRADAASGGGAEQLAQLYKVSSPTTPKRAASFSTSTKSPGSRRAGLCGFKDMDRLEGTTAAAEPELMPPVVLAATGKAIARRSGTSSGNNSSASAVSAVVDGHAALGPGSQGTAKDQLAQLTIGPAAAPASIATSGDGGIMARFLNQNFDGPPDPAAHNAASAGRHWDGPSKTQLAGVLSTISSMFLLCALHAVAQQQNSLGAKAIVMRRLLLLIIVVSLQISSCRCCAPAQLSRQQVLKAPGCLSNQMGLGPWPSLRTYLRVGAAQQEAATTPAIASVLQVAVARLQSQMLMGMPLPSIKPAGESRLAAY